MRSEERKSTLKITDFANKSLLIVDDDNPLRDRLSRAMEKKGFLVTQAESVKQGISKAKNLPPAFAVVDLRLNDGNGLEVVKEIQKLKKNSRIVLLTGYGNIPTAVAAVKAGAIDYIPKPADADDVENALLASPESKAKASGKSEDFHYVKRIVEFCIVLLLEVWPFRSAPSLKEYK